MNTKDIDMKHRKLKCLVYGLSGSGKTTFGSTFREAGKVWFADFDNGMLSLRGKDIDYTTYADKVLNGVLQKSALAQFMKDFEGLEKECEYNTIVIDSVTTLQKYVMSKILKDNSRSEPTLHEWGRLIDWLTNFFMRLTKMDKHIVVIAHEQLIQDDLTKEILVQPLIVGKKLPGQLPLYFDEVYRAQAKVVSNKTGERKYTLLTKASEKFTAKSRLNCLDTVEVPDYKVIMEKVSKSCSKE